MDIIKRPTNKEVYDNLLTKTDEYIASFYASRIKTGNGDQEFYFNLNPLSNISDMLGADKAADKIYDVLMKDDKIAVICDYDSDGCHSAAVVVRILTECGYGKNVKIFTPNRMTDGYGANPRIVNEAADWGASVIVTADNGIAAFEAATEADKLNIPFIITDHHIPSDKGYPKAYVIVDPEQDGCGWMGGVICGATVAFLVFVLVKDKLVENGIIDKNKVDAKRMFQLIGAATIADCVPLVGINRSIVKYGLKQLKENPYPGYKALIEAYDIKRIDEQVIGFKIGPAINSAGRLGEAAPSISFLVTEDLDEAEKCANFLLKSNKNRKEIQDSVIENVMAEIEEKKIFDSFEDPIYIFGDKAWHHGVVGIVSGRVTEKFNKPSFVFGGQENSDLLKGSGRAGGSDIHLKDFLDMIDAKYPGILMGYGGHAKAAGCSIKDDKLEDFADACNDVFMNDLKTKKTIIYVDDICNHDDFDKNNVNQIFNLLDMAPFGQEFPSPEIELKSIPREKIKTFGKGKDHISSVIAGIKCVGFNMSADLIEIEGSSISVILKPNYNYFRGNVEKQFFISRIYPSHLIFPT